MRTALIVAAYNRSSRIAPTLDSALRQSVAFDEILVVDDGSQDDTAEWIEQRYRTVRVLRTANAGTSAARNRGAAIASADLLVFLDHDDVLAAHALETLLALIARFPRAAAVFADHRYINTVTGERLSNHHEAVPAFHRLRCIRTLQVADGGDRLYGQPLFRALLRGNLLQQPYAIYRKQFLQLGGYSENVRYCEDWDLYLRLVDRFPIALTDRVISDHIIEGTNLHLTPNQHSMYAQVLRAQQRTRPRLDVRAKSIIRQRLAILLKRSGDEDRPVSLPRAFEHYRESLRLWPFDHVVAARTLLWWAQLRFRRGMAA